MNARTVSRVLAAVLLFQLGIGVLLVLGDMRMGAPRLPFTGPNLPQLDSPVRPGDQRREFRPTLPADHDGPLPDRLTLVEPDGTWRLTGAIAPGDADRIAAQIVDKGDAVQRVTLLSPGGSVQDALALGRLLRSRGIATAVADGAFCFSACPYLLAGGPKREIGTDAAIGVHQHSFGENTVLPAFLAIEDIQRGQAEVMRYLDEMGIDPRVMSHAMATPADEIYVLLPEELERYGFVTPEE